MVAESSFSVTAVGWLVLLRQVLLRLLLPPVVVEGVSRRMESICCWTSTGCVESVVVLRGICACLRFVFLAPCPNSVALVD